MRWPARACFRTSARRASAGAPAGARRKPVARFSLAAERGRQEIHSKRRSKEIGGSANVIGERPGVGRHVAEHRIADLPVDIGVENRPSPPSANNASEMTEAIANVFSGTTGSPAGILHHNAQMAVPATKIRATVRDGAGPEMQQQEIVGGEQAQRLALKALTVRPARAAGCCNPIVAVASLMPRRRSCSEGREPRSPMTPRPCSSARARPPAGACEPGCQSRSHIRRGCR